MNASKNDNDSNENYIDEVSFMMRSIVFKKILQIFKL